MNYGKKYSKYLLTFININDKIKYMNNRLNYSLDFL